jgi:hypothetical protein
MLTALCQHLALEYRRKIADLWCDWRNVAISLGFDLQIVYDLGNAQKGHLRYEQ